MLKELIKDFSENEAKNVPGFISARFHQNESETILINYSTWESLDAYQQFKSKILEVSERSKKIKAFNPMVDQVYEVNFF